MNSFFLTIDSVASQIQVYAASNSTYTAGNYSFYLQAQYGNSVVQEPFTVVLDRCNIT